MKQTVLEIVQDVMSELNSDNVNSIDDTVESQRVARLLKTVYYEIISQRTWADDKKLISLDSTSDSEKPNYLKLPTDAIQELYWIRYNRKRPDETRSFWETIDYLEPRSFLKHTNARNDTEANVTTVTDYDGTTLLIRNDLAPQYWTSFDDQYIVFDAWNSNVEATVQSSNSQAYVRLEPRISLVDEHVVDLPTEAFSMLISAVKNRAYLALKDQFNPLVDREEARQRNRMSRKSWQAKGGVRYANYGRSQRGRSLSAERTFKEGKY